MRASPRYRQQSDNVRRVLRSRRMLIAGTVIVALLSVGSTWAALKIDRGGLPAAPFARVGGASGNASGVAVGDGDVLTDGGVFATVGEAVTLQFGAIEMRGEVKAVRPESASVAVVRLLDGAIAPSWLAPSSYAGAEGTNALFVCIVEDGTVHSTRMRIEGNEARDLAALGQCGAGAVLVADTKGHEILAMVVTGSEGRRHLVPIETVELP